MAAVEVDETVRVAREVRRHEVEDDRDAGGVERVHQEHQIVRLAMAVRRREVAGHLVAPGAIERVLHERHELDVGELVLLQVLHQGGGDLAVAERAVRLLRHAAPRAEVHLVDGDRRLQGLLGAAVLHPGRVGPGVVERGDDRRGPGRRLVEEADRVCLVPAHAAAADPVLVLLSSPGAGDEPVPDAPFAPLERAGGVVPLVEISLHRDEVRLGRPHGEADAVVAPLRADVGAEGVVDARVVAAREGGQIGEKRRRGRRGGHGKCGLRSRAGRGCPTRAGTPSRAGCRARSEARRAPSPAGARAGRGRAPRAPGGSSSRPAPSRSREDTPR